MALLLVDGQKLLDHEGQEDRYLKSLVSTFRNSLLLLKDDLLESGRPLTSFPRIWIVTLSKADLLPGLDVHGFEELVIEKIGRDLADLREVLTEFVDSPEALSVGQDFLRISSAKFTPGSIDVAEREGIDLMLPLASVLPLQRHLRWAKAEKLSRKLGVQLLANAELVAAGLGAVAGVAARLAGRTNRLAGAVGLMMVKLAPNLERAIEQAGRRLEQQVRLPTRRGTTSRWSCTDFSRTSTRPKGAAS